MCDYFIVDFSWASPCYDRFFRLSQCHWYKGEIELADAISNTAIDAAKGYATGYSVTFLSKGMTHLSARYLGDAAASALTKSNAPLAIAAGVVTASKAMVAYMKGDIELEELQSQINHTAITCSSSFYYGALGQAVCPQHFPLNTQFPPCERVIQPALFQGRTKPDLLASQLRKQVQNTG